MCDSAFVKPLSVIFKNCPNCSTFPDIWKKSYIYPIHKKMIKQIINNYRPFFIFAYLRETLILNILGNKNYYQNISLTFNQITLVQISTCQLFMTYIQLSMLILILKCVVVFLDMSKVFDKVWYKGLIYKLRGIDISGPASKPIESFLNNRFQHIILNEPSSNLLPVKTDILQRSILEPLFF